MLRGIDSANRSQSFILWYVAVGCPLRGSTEKRSRLSGRAVRVDSRGCRNFTLVWNREVPIPSGWSARAQRFFRHAGIVRCRGGKAFGTVRRDGSRSCTRSGCNLCGRTVGVSTVSPFFVDSFPVVRSAIRRGTASSNGHFDPHLPEMQCDGAQRCRQVPCLRACPRS